MQLFHHLIIDMEDMDTMEDIIHMDIIIITTIIIEVLVVEDSAVAGGASSCACACACAGGGRAGCSKKDFYGTNLKMNKKFMKKT